MAIKSKSNITNKEEGVKPTQQVQFKLKKKLIGEAIFVHCIGCAIVTFINLIKSKQ